MAWDDLQRHGMTCNGMACHITRRHGMGWVAMAWDDLQRHGMPCNDKAWHEMSGNGMAWVAMAKHGMG